MHTSLPDILRKAVIDKDIAKVKKLLKKEHCSIEACGLLQQPGTPMKAASWLLFRLLLLSLSLSSACIAVGKSVCVHIRVCAQFVQGLSWLRA